MGTHTLRACAVDGVGRLCTSLTGGKLNHFLDTVYGKEIPSANLRPLKCNVWYNLSLKHPLPAESGGSTH